MPNNPLPPDSEQSPAPRLYTVNLLIVCATITAIVFLICYYAAHCNGFNPGPLNSPLKPEKQ